MLLDAIDHVQLAMPPGGEQLASWFYSEVLGVPEVPKPPHLAIRGGCWFEQGQIRIHLGVQQDFVPATKAHPAFAVVDLDRIERELRDAGIEVDREVDPIGPPSVYVTDPFGNRLEFRPAREVCERAEYSDTMVEVAHDVLGERFGAQLAFVQELDRLKSVERQSVILDGLRRENAAEHSWHIAVIAIVLAEHATEEVDLARVILLLLVHDIVEIDAGDVSIHDPDHPSSKADRERVAADRLFGLLPEDSGLELRAAWHEYEACETPEARFARVFDRLAPFLLNLGARGFSWRRGNVTAAMVRNVLEPIRGGAPALWSFVDAMIHRAVEDGLLPQGGSGIILPGQDDS